MSSPGQRRGSCGHAMAGFDTHSKCARCRDKGLGDDPCVQKKECVICKGFTPEQVLQLATPAYRDRKEKKTTTTTPANSTSTLLDPAHVSVLAKVEKGKAINLHPVVRRRNVVNHPSRLHLRRDPAATLQLKISRVWMISGQKDFQD